VAVLVLVSAVAVQAALRPTSMKSVFDMPRDRRRVFWLMTGLTAAVAGVCVWALAAHHAAVAIGVLVAVYVLPGLALMPVRIRRSRKRADAARAARAKRS
jgi:hypothetical protein